MSLSNTFLSHNSPCTMVVSFPTFEGRLRFFRRRKESQLFSLANWTLISCRSSSSSILLVLIASRNSSKDSMQSLISLSSMPLEYISCNESLEDCSTIVKIWQLLTWQRQGYLLWTPSNPCFVTKDLAAAWNSAIDKKTDFTFKNMIKSCQVNSNT